MRTARAGVTAMMVMVSGLSSPLLTAQASTSASSHLSIPFLANAGKPGALEFEGGECEVDTAGRTMECQFQQVFLTTSDVAPDTCLVTTSRYQRTFRHQADARWVSNEGPAGECGILDVMTLQDGGGVKWTMTLRKVVTRDNPPPACRGVNQGTETLDWRNLRRPLPCRFVQPGGLGR